MLRMRSRAVDRVRSTARSRTVVTDTPLAHVPVSARDRRSPPIASPSAARWASSPPSSGTCSSWRTSSV